MVFTASDLLEFDGKDGRKAYTAYEGVVYDVTDSKLWKLGEHFGLNAGVDLTERMQEAPHGKEVFAGFEVVGTLESNQSENLENTKVANPELTQLSNQATTQVEENKTEKPLVSDKYPGPVPLEKTLKWYQKRISFLGFSLLGWTGIFLAIFFVLTFGSCFALPWAKLPLPWKGSKIGPDPLDEAGKHMTWSSVHKHFVWVTVVIGIIHGIIGFLQMMGIYL
ncbi:MAG: hypothetical protein H6772_01690 [Pseudomonadales bacterium]|nr:hypothetical protein [Pseudomonadales bacterium]